MVSVVGHRRKNLWCSFDKRFLFFGGADAAAAVSGLQSDFETATVVTFFVGSDSCCTVRGSTFFQILVVGIYSVQNFAGYLECKWGKRSVVR